jgi:hypothetical protein
MHNSLEDLSQRCHICVRVQRPSRDAEILTIDPAASLQRSAMRLQGPAPRDRLVLALTYAQ